VESYVSLALAIILLAFGSVLLSLRALGLQNFNRVADKLTSISAGSRRLHERVLGRGLGPSFLVGMLCAAAFPTVYIAVGVIGRVQLPLMHYWLDYLQFEMQHVPPASAADWAVLFALSQLPFWLGILAIIGELALIDALPGDEVLSIRRRALVIAGLVVLSPIALALALYLAVITVVVMVACGLALAAGGALAVGIVFVVGLPVKLVSLTTRQLAGRNVERIAAIGGILLVVTSTVLLALR
jgi:hypothetical protein